MTLENAIAKQLAASNVGLFRKQLFDKIDRNLTHGSIDKISMSLNTMKSAGHVDKSPRIGLEGSRWSITPKGRAAYSVMHDDELHGEDLSPEQVEQKLAYLREGIGGERFKSIEFDTNDELDRGLFGIVELIRGVASQSAIVIHGKAECLAELEKLETSEFLANKTRAILTRVRLAIAELEDTE